MSSSLISFQTHKVGNSHSYLLLHSVLCKRKLRFRESKFVKIIQLVRRRPREPDRREKDLPTKLNGTLGQPEPLAFHFLYFFQEPQLAFLWVILICFYFTHMVACLLYGITLFQSDPLIFDLSVCILNTVVVLFCFFKDC